MTQSKNAVIASILALALSAATAAVDIGSLPKLNSGLWVTTVTNDGMKPTTHSMCMDEATQQRMLTLGQGLMAGMCKRSDLRRDGDAFVFETDCAMGPMRVISTSRTTFTVTSAYRSESTAKFDPPMAGMGATRSVAQGRHSGACPAGMKPGDMKLPDGRIMNINNLPGMMAPPR